MGDDIHELEIQFRHLEVLIKRGVAVRVECFYHAAFFTKMALTSGTYRYGIIAILFATLLIPALITAVIVADQEDDYVACLIETATKIMKTQTVKDPAKALDEAAKRCQPPPRITYLNPRDEGSHSEQGDGASGDL